MPLILIGLIVFINLNFVENNFKGSVIVVNIVMVVFFVISYLPLINIKKVEYNNSKLIVSNFRITKEYNLTEVKSIYLVMFFFYNIIIETENESLKIRYLAPARERSLNPFKTIDSVREFKRIIKK